MTDPTDTPTDTPTWYRQLTALLAAGFDPDGEASGGAQLTVTDATGTISYQQPLARHARLDTDCVWIRPIIGTGPGFDLAECRRRGLSTTGTITATPQAVTFELADGAQAAVQPAAPELLDTLDQWDTFVLSGVDATTEAALTALDADTVWPDP